MEPSSSCSSPREALCEEEWPLELLDDCSEIDGEVGKRLNQMVPIPVSNLIEMWNVEFQVGKFAKYTLHFQESQKVPT